MRSTRINAGWIAAVAVMTVLLASCSSSDSDAGETMKAPTPTVPKGFEVPAGVTLTDAGTALKAGSPASIAYQLGDGATSAVTVTVAEVTKGTIEDFRFFSLDDATKKSTPYYVKVNVKNEGPAGLGGAALPIYAFDSTSTNLPANDIVGTFKPCPTPKLPDTFLPGAAADVCLVYLVPEGRTLTSVNLQPGSTKDAIRWTS